MFGHALSIVQNGCVKVRSLISHLMHALLTFSGLTIEGLFKQYFSPGGPFRHDIIMEEYAETLSPEKADEDTQMTNCSFETSISIHISPSPQVLAQRVVADPSAEGHETPVASLRVAERAEEARHAESGVDENEFEQDSVIAYLQGSQESQLSENALDVRLRAFRAILDNATKNMGHDIGLLSTRDHHTELEQDLGER